MALETGTYISDLNASNPTAGDPISAGDDHIRLLKATIKATFPNLTGAMSATQVELNYLSGLSANVQTQLNAKAALAHTHAEEDITDGGIFPRLAATEVISGSWNFTTRPQVNGNGVLDSASSIPETQIADGTVFPRIAANETITGSWAFSGTVNVGGLNVGASPVWHAGNFNPTSYSLTTHTHSGYASVEFGFFTAYLRADSVGGTILTSGTAYWTKIGNIVHLRLPELTGTTASASLYITGLPGEITPGALSGTGTQSMAIAAYKLGSLVPGMAYILEQTSYIQLTAFEGWSVSSGTKGLLTSHPLTYHVSG